MPSIDPAVFYSDLERCREALCEARTLFGLKTTTESQYDKMMDVLAFVYLYCPVELQTAALQTLNEATTRRLYFDAYIWSL